MSDLATNTETLNRHLARFRTDGILNLINGESRPAASGATFETSSPVDESVICSVAKGSAEDIDAAAWNLANSAMVLGPLSKARIPYKDLKRVSEQILNNLRA